MLWVPKRLRAPSVFIVLLSLASPVAAARQAATATDCSRATTREEKAICTTPELRAADAAMAKAYSVLKAELPRAQQAALFDDQGRWLVLRDGIRISPTGAPVVESDPDLIGRLLKETDGRREFLAGEGPNRAPDAPRLRPVFFQSRDGGDENVVYPRIVKPRSSSELDFNKVARSIATQEAVQPPGQPVPSSATGGADECYDYDASYEVTYLDRRLAAVVFTISSYGYNCNDRGMGAAHPQEGRQSLVFDFSRGRALTMADIIASPAKAISAIAERCKSQLADADVSVDQFESWAPDKSGVDILFDPFSIDGNAFGFQKCRLSWADLSPWLKPGGPLPPH